ncbi:hypothetical protein PENTCL1PPCAC_1960, partial [Pristionchus entomophagus]
LYISLIFIGYLLCDLSIVAYAVISQCTEDNNYGILRILNLTNSVTYSYLLPLVFFSTVERLAATSMVKKYENIRPWGLVVASQMLFLSTFFRITIIFSEEMGDRVRNYMYMAIEICIYIVVLTLLLINQRRTRLRECYDYTELTCRYQLAENIRACRFLMTFVLFDSLITVTDIIADVGFHV